MPRHPWPERLETGRLTLRPLEAGDLPVLVRLIGEWEVSRWLIHVPHPYTDRDAAGWLAATRAWVRERRGLHLVAVPHGEAGMVGAVGLRHEPVALGEGEGELGYWLARHAWGRGYGTEMARAMVDAGFRHMGLRAVQAGTDPANDASHRVLLKAGLEFTHVDPLHTQGLRGPPSPGRRYRITREEWEARDGR